MNGLFCTWKTVTFRLELHNRSKASEAPQPECRYQMKRSTFRFPCGGHPGLLMSLLSVGLCCVQASTGASLSPSYRHPWAQPRARGDDFNTIFIFGKTGGLENNRKAKREWERVLQITDDASGGFSTRYLCRRGLVLSDENVGAAVATA